MEDRNLLNGSALTSLNDLSVDATRFNPNDLIVALRPDTGTTDLAAVAPNIVLDNFILDPGSGLFRVDLQPGVSVAQAQAFFQLQSYVRYTSPDYVVSASVIPNDPSFSSQWGLNNTGQTGGTAGADVKAPAAWDVTTGSGATIVAVIDTGVDLTHPDLAANIWTNTAEIPGNGTDDDHNGFVDDVHGWNFVANSNNPNDDNGHGSHVSGIIGAVGNNGVGVTGVNWRVQIMPVKFLDANGSGSLSNAVLALNYAVNNGATISNNSWGGGGFYQPMLDAINTAKGHGTQGHIFVAAAGNSGTNNDTTAFYPANYHQNTDNVVTVAATDANDHLASFSNFGAATVDLGAPGVSVYSTYKNAGYATLSGTSMATPFVTGAMALVRDLHPGWTYRQVIDQVLNNADPIAALAGRTVTGGRLDLAKAVGTPPPDTTGPRVTAAAFSGAAPGTFDDLRLTFSEAIKTGSFDPGDVVNFKRNNIDISGLTYTITQVSTTLFDVKFAAQSAAGAYTMTIGPNAFPVPQITDLAGNAMDQNANGVNGEIPQDQFTASGAISAGSQTFNSADVPKTLPDLATTTSVLNVNQNLTIGKLTVKFNIIHTYDSDLRISLRSPGGTSVSLVNRRGGSGHNFTNTVLDDAASTAIRNGRAPFTGSFRPEVALSAFNGQNASGTWSLIVSDVAALDSGVLNSWSITITAAGGAAGSGFGGSADAPMGLGGDETKFVAAAVFSAEVTAAPAIPTADAPRPQTPTSAMPANDDATSQHQRQSNADVGFVVVGAPAKAVKSADWLDFDAKGVLDVGSDLIDV